MSQEEIKRVIFRFPKRKFNAIDLSQYIDISVNQIRVCMKKLKTDIEHGWDDDLKWEEVKCCGGRRGVKLILFKG